MIGEQFDLFVGRILEALYLVTDRLLITDAAACMGAEAFTGAAGTSLTADIKALERKPANDVAD